LLGDDNRMELPQTHCDATLWRRHIDLDLIRGFQEIVIS
jgi:hypothetical protein